MTVTCVHIRKTFVSYVPLYVELSRQLGADGHVSLVIPRRHLRLLDEQPALADALREAGIAMTAVGHRHFPGRSDTMSAALLGGGLCGAIHRAQPDAILVIGEPGYPGTLQTLNARRRFAPSAKVLVQAHQNVLHRFPFPLGLYARLAESAAYRGVDALLWLGDDQRELVRAKGYRGTGATWPIGVDLSIFGPMPTDEARRSCGLPADRPVVGLVGRMAPVKGVDLLIDAIARLGRPEVIALIIGPGEQTEELTRHAEARGVDARFLGAIPFDKLRSYYCSMDVAVTPSRFVPARGWRHPLKEQFGRVIVEAMACGIPVAGSDSGGIPGVVGDAGLIFKEGDVEGFATVLQSLLDDPAERRRLGAIGIERAKQYRWDVVTADLLGILADLGNQTNVT